jgi:NAD(P)H-hydrate repair Nnr-like enzyme with NAD(P)H-hydrate epimerase domain
MAIKTLGAKAAAALDQELMSTGAFSLDQLMELAGLAVSQAGELLNSSVTSYMSLLSTLVSFLAVSQGL